MGFGEEVELDSAVSPQRPPICCTSETADSKTRKGSCCLPTLSTSETIAAVPDPVLQSQV